MQFVVTVQNASNPAVTWEANGIPGGNSSAGTITPAGVATASYVAPANVAATVMVTVSAVLQANGTTSGSATVTVSPSSGVQISISPLNASVVQGMSLQFSATVQNGPPAVIWLVNNIAGGNSTFGTVNSSGFYTAPSRIPNPSVATITALLATNSAISGSTSITIIPPAVSVSISPSTANLATNQTLQFGATVQNSNAGVVWEVNGVAGGNPALGFGTITSSGSYIAPGSVPSDANITVTAVLQTSPPVSASAGVTIVPPGSFTGVFSWRNDSSLTGQDSDETTLTPANVQRQFGKVFGCPVDGQIHAQPLYVSNAAIPNLGTHNVVYVATEHDSVYAFDADTSSCEVLWQVSFIDEGAGVTTVPASDLGLQQDIVPEIGITGTPVIDPATATLYVVAKTKENLVYVQRVHALDLTTGAEKFGAPVVIQARVSGNGDGTQSGQISFNALTENQRSALLLAGGNVYVAFDSYEDTDPVHGWLFAYGAANLTQAPLAVFNSTPNGSRGGIGESGAAPASDGNGNIFVATSDGTFDAGTGGSDYAESLLRVNTNSGFTVADRFTPPNPGLQLLGSNGVLLLATAAGSVAHPNLAIVGSHEGSLYLLDRDNLTKDGALQALCLSMPVNGTSAYWAANKTIYVAAAGGTLEAFPLANGSFSSALCPSTATASSQSPELFNTYGASPVISSNGTSNGIVWALDNSGYAGAGGASSPAILHTMPRI